MALPSAPCLAIVLVGNSSTHVEFNWRDAVPVKRDVAGTWSSWRSMTLFRPCGDGVWSLNSVYEVD